MQGKYDRGRNRDVIKCSHERYAGYICVIGIVPKFNLFLHHKLQFYKSTDYLCTGHKSVRFIICLSHHNLSCICHAIETGPASSNGCTFNSEAF